MSNSSATEEIIANLAKIIQGPQLQMLSKLISGEMMVLRYLLENNQAQPREIGNVMNISSARVARLMTTLMQKGFIKCEKDPADKRKIVVTLTDSGRGHIEQQVDTFMQQVEAFFEELGEDDTQALALISAKAVEINESKAKGQDTCLN